LSDDNKLRCWAGFIIVLGLLLYWEGAFHSENWAYLVLGLLMLYGLGIVGMSIDKLVDLVEGLGIDKLVDLFEKIEKKSSVEG